MKILLIAYCLLFSVFGFTQKFNATFNSIATEPYTVYYQSDFYYSTPKTVKKALSKKFQIHQLYDSTFCTTYDFLVYEHFNFYINLNHPITEQLFNLKASRYAFIDSLIKEQHLPDFIALIPLVVSAYNADLYNELNQSGIWGLSYPVAAKYGLKLSSLIDERKNDRKATFAALKWITHLHQKYKDWNLTLAAYFSSPTLVNTLINQHETTKIDTLKKHLPNNVKNLLSGFYAMNYIASNKEKYGFEWAPQYFTIPDGVYEVPKNLYVEALKKYVNVDDKAFHYYNRELRKNIIPKCYRLKLDSEAYKGLTVWIDSIYYYQDSVLLKPKVIEPEVPVIPEGAKEVVYTVKSGDVLGLIAEKYGVKVSEIQDWNNLTSTRIDIGDELIIYLDSNAVSIPDTSQNKVSTNTSANHKKIKINEKDNSKYVLYTVKPGDNLWLIAKKFPGISAQNIMDLNGIDENLKPGQVLRIKKK